MTYRGAGVDVGGIAGSRARIGRIISRTHGAQAAARVAHGFGHYAGIVDVGGGTLLATHTDGVGTKVLVAAAMERYDTVGIDCVAMNVNDVVCTGAVPVSFVDYIAASRNDGDALAAIARGLARGARRGAVPIVGGETAIMPGLFGRRGFSFDLAGTVVGLVPKGGPVLGGGIRKGDVVVGARSNGLHSNGYSLARKALSKFPLGASARGVGRVGDALLAPTRIYARPVLEILEKCEVRGLAHITGGSFAKLSRLNAGVLFDLDSLPRPPPIMRLIAEQGVDEAEMYGTFNMGVGFCAVVPRGEEGEAVRIFRKHKIGALRVGTVAAGRGVVAGRHRLA